MCGRDHGGRLIEACFGFSFHLFRTSYVRYFMVFWCIDFVNGVGMKKLH